jgi:TetR/AcrR family transcriptional repressor of nem operon
MGRPRGFDEQAVIKTAAALFASRTYDGLSVDDLVTGLGVHRNSLYKTFGSKRGLYLTALRWYLEHGIAPLVTEIGSAADPQAAIAIALAAGQGDGLDLLLLAAVERAPVDAEVGAVVAEALASLDEALRGAQAAGGEAAREVAPLPVSAVTAALLGLRLRARAGAAGEAATGIAVALAGPARHRR